MMRTRFGIASVLQTIRDQVEVVGEKVGLIENHSSDGDDGTGKRKRARIEGEVEDDVLEPPVSLSPTPNTKVPVPPHLLKYYKQRYRLFSLYDSGCQLDEQGWYSVTPENIAAHIAQRSMKALGQGAPRILDPMAGVGGNAIQFAQAGAFVVAIEIDKARLECAKANARIYGVDHFIEFVHDDWITWIKNYPKQLFDLVFLSPPWGGINYQEKEMKYDTSKIRPIPIKDQYQLAKKSSRDGNVVLYLPRNTDPDEIASLDPLAKVEVEYVYTSKHLKAIAAYFGNVSTYVQ